MTVPNCSVVRAIATLWHLCAIPTRRVRQTRTRAAASCKQLCSENVHWHNCGAQLEIPLVIVHKWPASLLGVKYLQSKDVPTSLGTRSAWERQQTARKSNCVGECGHHCFLGFARTVLAALQRRNLKASEGEGAGIPMNATARFMGPTIRIAVIESGPLRFAGFGLLLGSETDFEVSAMSLAECEHLHDGATILLSDPGGRNLIRDVARLKAVRPDLRIVATGSATDENTVLDVIASGAKGYVDEAASAAEFVQAIRIVNRGSLWVSRRILSMFIERANRFEGAPFLRLALFSQRGKGRCWKSWLRKTRTRKSQHLRASKSVRSNPTAPSCCARRASDERNQAKP
jgi:DNA-binding NarL/FixJ family response regulator